VPHERRKIPIVQMSRDEALQAFVAWAKSPNRIRY
jgi:hypothetical protein